MHMKASGPNNTNITENLFVLYIRRGKIAGLPDFKYLGHLISKRNEIAFRIIAQMRTFARK